MTGHGNFQDSTKLHSKLLFFPTFLTLEMNSDLIFHLLITYAYRRVGSVQMRVHSMKHVADLSERSSVGLGLERGLLKCSYEEALIQSEKNEKGCRMRLEDGHKPRGRAGHGRAGRGKASQGEHRIQMQMSVRV